MRFEILLIQKILNRCMVGIDNDLGTDQVGSKVLKSKYNNQ
jgi:hypothetical protein